MPPDTGAEWLSIADLAAAYRQGTLSPVDATDACLAQIEATEDRVRAFVTVMVDAAREAARRSAERYAAGDPLGPLDGVPVAVKDICDTRGVRTTASSRVREEHIPTRDAAVVERLHAAGAVILGKTVTHEFAFGMVSAPTRNPWNLDKIPGGSSGGSGAAVVAGQCYGAIGSDTGGSIRVPASLNGVTGLKPTFGLVSKWGTVPLSWSMDHLGPLTRTAQDAALMLSILAGHDRRDPTSVDAGPHDFQGGLERGVAGLRFGVPTNYYFDRLDPEVEAAVRTAIDTFREAGATIVEVTIPAIEHSVAAGSAIVMAEASSYHAKTLRGRPGDYGPDVRWSLEMGEFLLATHYLKAQRARVIIKRGFQQALRGVDALLAPTIAATAGDAPAGTVFIGGRRLPVMAVYMRHALPANLAGLPALSVPCGFSRDGLPMGLQIIGRPFAESTVLRAGHTYQSATDWHHQRPPL